MTIEKHVLVVDRPQGALSGVMAELDQLGFRVVWVPSLEAALDFVKSHPRLSLLLATAAAVADGGDRFLVEMKELEPGVPIVWGVRSGRPSRSPGGPNPDTVIAEPFQADELRNVAARLLSEHFYPRTVADAVTASALEVLEPYGSFSMVGDAYLKANQTTLCDLSAMMTFSGEATGHLMLGMRLDHGRELYRRAIPLIQHPTTDAVEDMLGELCNQILGRINACFAAYQVLIEQTTPIFIRSTGSVMRFRGRQPSFGAELADAERRIFLEYYLDGIDVTRLERRIPTDIVGLGEIRYF